MSSCECLSASDSIRPSKTLEIDGLVTLSVHVRELTDEEKKASSKKNVVLLTPKS